ncbi:hypothetical protein NQU49_26395, partial [Escherichia coli]|uniref:hypothetical protein n=1 Tax=Escherichia coli TaxID=562 RepID=UPI002117C861
GGRVITWLVARRTTGSLNPRRFLSEAEFRLYPLLHAVSASQRIAFVADGLFYVDGQESICGNEEDLGRRECVEVVGGHYQGG